MYLFWMVVVGLLLFLLSFKVRWYGENGMGPAAMIVGPGLFFGGLGLMITALCLYLFSC